MKDRLIDKELVQSISPILAKPLIMKCVVKLGGFDKVNRVYDSAKYKSGTDIEDAMIDGLGITRKVHNIDVLKQFEDKPFITVSNHPYGHVDGIMLVGEVAKVRPDFKIMVNWMLGQVDIMQDHFIGVNPYSAEISSKSSFNGLKECIKHLHENHPLGFFPAGAISKTVGFNKIKDKEWQESILKLIHKARVPVIPAYFSGQNSRFSRQRLSQPDAGRVHSARPHNGPLPYVVYERCVQYRFRQRVSLAIKPSGRPAGSSQLRQVRSASIRLTARAASERFWDVDIPRRGP